ncbi:amino acid aminotransferase [uncultured Roseobacter sp.]|uniref:amino acid aminotransferase n=1 Tax=uncultured Roseobacter sp. TaxID=114847 RepID=UPI0026043C68|nr:amino acid aminotransferase [uncultured Roseobacter sp.]
MFETLKPRPADGILTLMQLFKDDPRPTKIDLGVGVYKDATGLTPVMRAVKSAEEQLWQTQDSKVYTSLAGDPAFSDAMIQLVLGGHVPRETISAVATPGGTGAVRQAFELVQMANPDARVFVSDPTWPNHLSILSYLGIEAVPYRYFDADSRGVDVDGMMQDLAAVRRGDVVLLHGCCHNPTGANLTMTDWQAVVDLLLSSGAVPMIDIAYQGFGEGLEEDAEATRLVASSVPECLIAASCSKNFGIYRERTGLLMAISQEAEARKLNQETLAFLNRQNFSFPPDHGARLVTMILNDDALRADWETELNDVRESMLGLRHELASELQRLSGSDRFGFLAQHRGMFSRLGTTPEKVAEMREQHGIYMVADSRMNIAGLNRETVPLLAKAIIDVGI